MSEIKPSGLAVSKVQIQMWGELTNIRKQVIFTKMISLNRLNYDMIEGEAMVKLRDYL